MSGFRLASAYGSNLKIPIPNLELLEPSENQTLDLLNLGLSYKTEPRTSQKTDPNLEPSYIDYRISKNG